MNKNQNVVNRYALAVLLPVVLSGCFAPWQGEQNKAENGWLIIGKDTRAKTTVPNQKELDGMTYRITLTGPGKKVERTLGNGGGAVDIAAGDWQYSVTAWNSDPRIRGFAGGRLRITPGGLSRVTLKSAIGIKSEGELQDILTEGTDMYRKYHDNNSGTLLVLEQDITLSKNILFTGQSPFFLIAEPGKSRIIHRESRYSINVQAGALTLGNGDLPGATGTLTLGGDIGTGGSFINVGIFGKLILGDGAVIQNSRADNGGAVYVAAKGNFTMNGGSISNNITTNSGGGVFVDNGIFTMHGGIISGNTALSGDGGGVYVDNSGIVIMEGGTISDNNTNSNGGGVYIIDGIFTMRDGSIKNNTSGSLDGAGVYVDGGGTFTMEGGIISGNTARSNGGGVCIYLGTFKKTGAGTIYGKNEGMSSNTAGSGNKNGHAVYYSYYNNNSSSYYYHYRDTTIRPGDTIDTTVVPPLGFEN